MRRRTRASGEAAFTLIELLIAIALTGLVMGLITSTFSVCIRSWEEAEADMALLTAGEEAMAGVAVGLAYVRGHELGLEDAVAVPEGDETRAAVLPPWRLVARPGRDKTVPLEPRLQAGAPPPVAFLSGSRLPLRVEVLEGRGALRLLDPVKDDASVILYYRPEDAVAQTRLVFTYDALAGRLARSYAGETRLFPVNACGTRVESLRFRYLLAGGGDEWRPRLTASHLPVRAVQIELTLAKGEKRRTLTRVVELPNAGRTILLTRSAPAVALLPAPDRIRALELRYLAGAEAGKRILLRAGAWKCEIRFLSPEIAVVEERLPGFPDRKATMHAAAGLSLLNPDIVLDRDGTRSPGPGARDDSGDLKPGDSLASFAADSRMLFVDRNRSGQYEEGETLFWDANRSRSLDSADKLVLQTAPDPESAPVRSLRSVDAPVLYLDSRNAGVYDDGEDLVWDGDGDGLFGGAYYDCGSGREPVELEVELFEIEGATLIVR